MTESPTESAIALIEFERHEDFETIWESEATVVLDEERKALLAYESFQRDAVLALEAWQSDYQTGLEVETERFLWEYEEEFMIIRDGWHDRLEIIAEMSLEDEKSDNGRYETMSDVTQDDQLLEVEPTEEKSSTWIHTFLARLALIINNTSPARKIKKSANVQIPT